MNKSTTERRRGDDLEQAIFQNALTILNNEGYDAISFARIARESNTSRSVLYHHWDSPFDLTLAAIHDQNPDGNNTLSYYDTGSLRSDLIFIGQYFIIELERIPQNFRTALLSVMSSNPNKVQKMLTNTNKLTTEILDQALATAITRGDISKLPNDTSKNSFFKLIRYSFVIENHPINQAELEDIIDSIVLPVLTQK
ncbi:TetR/AcrR family transcriptional regulator [Lentilactobacillus kosonis]|uniref:Transcriptional regulator, TetR family n=1 Tax=Lentilactobacillus kosonis TaxID=2810561 RepID=A0A401FHU1_9LACO|nr:TetR/AcrR family transcriptional regulator [Lentilactobacillus kosonis]GAY71912.1 transcriptional regulator, TetR family [Lentilactobacillus kosonis]